MLPTDYNYKREGGGVRVGPESGGWVSSKIPLPSPYTTAMASCQPPAPLINVAYLGVTKCTCERIKKGVSNRIQAILDTPCLVHK